MNTRVQTFFQYFNSNIQTEIINFCNRITSIEADVFILMARKSACFFNCLEELRIVQFNGYVTSERILDMDCQWLRDKSVVIIDDSIVSGTTLHSTIMKLKEHDVSSISVHVLTVNDRWFMPELLEGEDGVSYLYQEYNRLPDSQCIKLCNDIVRSISCTPRPYDIDFPYYNEIIVQKETLHKLIYNLGWEIYDISSYEQIENGVSSITVIPTEPVFRDFCRENGLSRELFCLFKIRMYCRLNAKKKDMYHIRLVPMLIFDELPISVITTLFDALTTGVTNTDLAMNEKAKLRLLQFYLSDKLAKFWYRDVKKYLQGTDNLYFEDRNLTFLFPGHLVYEIKTLCESNVKMPAVRYSKLDPDMTPSEAHDGIGDEKNHVAVDSLLTTPFLQMFYDKELPCRELVLEHGLSAFESDEFQEHVNRLNTGISVTQLSRLITGFSHVYHVPTRVSIFIDKSIDAGIIVPITEVQKGMIYRSYRHGEDVLFSEREETMYLSMLEHFQKYSNRTPGLSGVLTEKLIVLFTEIGIREKFLIPYISHSIVSPNDNNYNIDNVLRIKTHLHGKVALIDKVTERPETKHKPYITTERKGRWFTSLYTRKQKFKVVKDREQGNEYYQIVPVNTGALTDEDIGKVQIFAQLMADVCNPNVDTGITFKDTDLVKVTSSVHLKSVVRSIAAEVNIFREGYTFDFYPANDNIAHDYKNILRFQNNKERTSIHSAYMKMNAYVSGEAKSLVEQVKFNRNTDASLWRIYFKEELGEDITDQNRFLQQLFDQQQIWVYTTMIINTCLYCILLHNYQLSYDASTEANKPYRLSKGKYYEAKSNVRNLVTELEEYLKTRPAQDKLAIQIIALVNEVMDIVDAQMMVSNDYIEKLDYLNEEKQLLADGMQDDVCCALGSDGKVRNVIRYNNVLCVQFYMPDRDKLEFVQERIKGCLKRTESQIARKLHPKSPSYPPVISFLPENESPTGFDRSGPLHEVWLRATSDMGAELTALSLNIYYELTRFFIPVRAVLLTNMRYSDCIRSDDQDVTKYWCNNFEQSIQQLKSQIYPLYIDKSEVVMLTEESAVKGSKAIAFMEENAKNLYELTGSETIDIRQSDRRYLKTQYKLKDNQLEDGGTLMHKDIAIITVLPEECTAVRNTYNLEEKKFDNDNRLYYHGTAQGDGVVHSVIMTQTFSPGAASIISAYADIMSKFSPGIIFVIGIAGAIDDDLKLCDVVVPREVFCYDMSKDTPDGIVRRGDSYKITSQLIPVIQRLQQTITTKQIDGRNFEISFDPIGSGSVVVAHKLSKITEYLKVVNSKVAAVEMEASGICSAVYEDGVSLKQPAYGVMNFRGISDMADENKPTTKEARVPAAENAALVSLEFARVMPKLKAKT